MKRIESLQTLRALAFISIFLSHCDLLPTGPMGVSIFLILSGFLMYGSYFKKGVEPEIKHSGQFAIRKISKLYPLHLLILSVMVAVTTFTQLTDEIGSVEKAALNGLLLQAWVPNSKWYFTYNKVSWYLSVCLFVYFAFPLLYRLICNISIKQNIFRGGVLFTFQICISIMLSTILSDVVSPDVQKWLTYIFPLYRLLDFYYGMLLGKMFFETDGLENIKPDRFIANVLELVLIAVWCAQIVLYRRTGLVAESFRYSLFWLPVSLSAVLLFAWSSGFVTKALSSRALIFVGNISGTAFLTHQIIIGFTKILIHNKYLTALTAFTVTIIVSVVYQRLEIWVLNHVTKK